MATIEKQENGTFSVSPQGDSQVTLATENTYLDKNIVFNIDIEDAISKLILDKLYPVGSIYFETTNTNPSALLGGTWEAYGASDTYLRLGGTKTGGSNSYSLTSSNIPSHTHSIGAHSHTLNEHTHTVGAHSHGLNSHTHSVGAHNHGLNSHTHSWSNSHSHTLNNKNLIWLDTNASRDSLYVVVSESQVGCYLNHGGTNANSKPGVPDNGVPSVASQSISGTTGAASGSTANSTAFTSGAASGSTADSTAFTSGKASGNTGEKAAYNTGSYGSSTVTAVSIEPKYVSVYAWKRTA